MEGRTLYGIVCVCVCVCVLAGGVILNNSTVLPNFCGEARQKEDNMQCGCVCVCVCEWRGSREGQTC